MSKQAKVLNKAELKKLLNYVKISRYAERNRLVVMLSFLAGLRAVEIANLRVCDVIGRNGAVQDLIVLAENQTKGKDRQTVYVSKKLKAEIKKYLKLQPYLLENPRFRLISSQKGNFNSQTIQNLFRKLYTEAGIDHASSHSGRRTFITELSNNGISVHVIKKLARHSSLSVTQRYIDISEDKIIKAINSI